jgi:hypothetical protein
MAVPAIEGRTFIGFDTEFDFIPNATGSTEESVFSIGAECRRIGFRATYGPGSWFVRFRGGFFFLPGDTFGLSAGLAIPIWALRGQDGQHVLGFDAFADVAFPFVDPQENWTGVDWSCGALFFLAPAFNGLAIGARLSSSQGIMPFVAYTGRYLAGKNKAKGALE